MSDLPSLPPKPSHPAVPVSTAAARSNAAAARQNGNPQWVPLLADHIDLLADEVERLEAEGVDKMADRFLEETKIRSMDFRDGLAMDLEPAREQAAIWVGVARGMLGDAPNYTETSVEIPTDDDPKVSMEVKLAGEVERYAFVLQRVGKLTPHQARMQAEAERNEARAEAEQLRKELDTKRAALERAEDNADALEAELERLRYERRLLGAARMTLDLIAVGDPTRQEEARRAAEDVAQRIVDEIGHPVTDEPALGPTFREEIKQLRAERARWAQRHERVAWLARRFRWAWQSARRGRRNARAEAKRLRAELDLARGEMSGRAASHAVALDHMQTAALTAQAELAEANKLIAQLRAQEPCTCDDDTATVCLAHSPVLRAPARVREVRAALNRASEKTTGREPTP